MENKAIISNDSLCLTDDKKSLLVLITDVLEEVTADHLLQLFCHSQYSDFKLSQPALAKAAAAFKRLQNQVSFPDKPQTIVIAECLDAQLSVDLSADKIQVKASIISAYGGLAITIEQLSNEMKKLKIKRGIIKTNIRSLIKKSKLADSGSKLQAIIAKGSHPVHATDSIFKRLVETPKERLKKPQKNKDGSVDMRNLGQLITVNPGTQLMRKIPSIQGRDGVTATGDVILHTSAKDFDLEAGENTKISDKDENLLIATQYGIPKELEHGMKVNDVLTIPNVDVGYGHVNFSGSVIIEGDVCDGMKVYAGGDITISGFVQSAQLKCEGDLIVGKGLIGRNVEEGSDHYSCQAQIKGSVTAHFSQYAKIVAGEDVHIAKQLLHCHVTCQGDINVLDESGFNGIILGGSLHTSSAVNTASLGAHAGSKTIVDLIGNYPTLMGNKQLISDNIQDEKGKFESLVVAQRKVDIMPNSAKKKLLKARLIATKDQVRKQLADLNADLSDNNDEIELYFDQANVITKKELFNDVYITIGPHKFISNRNYGPTKVSFKDKKIEVIPFLE